MRKNANEIDLYGDDEDDDDSKKEIEFETETPRYSTSKRRNVLDDDDDDDDVVIVREERSQSLSNLDVCSDIDIRGTVKDSPFTPFAEKSRVFTEMMGNTEDLFKNLHHPMSDDPSTGKIVKKRLNFGYGGGNDDNRNGHAPMNTFRIKWRYDDGYHNEEARFVNIDAVRMDKAVQQFMDTHAHSTVKLMSVKMILMG